jgi:hypothetical protein
MRKSKVRRLRWRVAIAMAVKCQRLNRVLYFLDLKFKLESLKQFLGVVGTISSLDGKELPVGYRINTPLTTIRGTEHNILELERIAAEHDLESHSI